MITEIIVHTSEALYVEQCDNRGFVQAREALYVE